MRDYLLFAVVPYVAALTFAPVCAARYLGGRTDSTADAARRIPHDGPLPRVAWRLALAVVLFGHALALAFPDYLLIWDRQLFRMIVLEVTGALAGGLATAGLLSGLVRAVRARQHGRSVSSLDIIAGTLTLVAMVSGVGTAVIYRWASSWSEVTLIPYLRSILRLDPSTTLVTHLPLLVKLHVVCAFVLLAALPFSDLSRLVVEPVDRLARRTVAPMVNRARAARPAIAARIGTHARTWSARLLRNGTEEN